MRLQRRQLLETPLIAAGLVATSAMSVFAKAPMAGSQATSIHRMKLGNFEVTTILDGYLEIDPRLLNATPELVTRLLAAADLPYGPIRTPVNTFLINTGEKLVLMDAGGAKLVGPGTGRLTQGLAEAGLPGYESGINYTVFVPARTPADIVQKLNTEINTVLKMGAVLDRLLSLGIAVRTGTVDNARARSFAETERWAKVIKTGNLTFN